MDRRLVASALFEHLHKPIANDFAAGDEACTVLRNGRKPSFSQLAIVRWKIFGMVERQQIMNEESRSHIGAMLQPIEQKMMFAPSIEHVQINGIFWERPVDAGKPMANVKGDTLGLAEAAPRRVRNRRRR